VRESNKLGLPGDKDIIEKESRQLSRAQTKPADVRRWEYEPRNEGKLAAVLLLSAMKGRSLTDQLAS
jgi:hypothetical protein